METCPHVTTRKRTRDTAAAAAAESNTSGVSNTAARRGRAPSEAPTNAETDVVDVDGSGCGDGAERTRRGGSTRCIDEHDTSASRSSNDSSSSGSSGSGSKDDEGGGGGSRDGKTRARSRVHATSVTKATSARLSSGGNSNNNNNNNSHGTVTAAVVAPRASEERRRSSGAHSHPRASHAATAAAPAPPSSSASSTCAPHSHRTRASDAGERIDVSPSKPRCGSGNSSGGNSSVVVAATGTTTATSVSRHAAVTSCVAVDAAVATTTTTTTSANNSAATSSSSSSSSGGGDGGAAAAAAGNVAGDMHSNSSAAAAGGEARRYKQPTLAAYGLVSDTAALRKELADKEQQLDEATRRAGALEEAARRHADELAVAQQQLGALHARLQRFRAVMREEMLRTAKQSRAEARRVLHARHFELGHIAVLPHNGREVWVEGDAVRSVLVQLRDVQARRDEVEQLKKNAQALVKQLSRQDKERDDAAAAVSSSASASSSTAAAAATNNNSNNATTTTTADAYEALLEAQEELQLRTAEHAALTAALVALRERHTALEHEKKAFLKEIRRVNDEDASEFVARATMGDDGRYVLMHLLGKGGFSEVWCAFDLAEARYVACKVHRVSPEWPAATREHYLHHAERELAIMRAVRHPHVVQLYDVFRLHESAFVSVMEYSHGMDLDTYLKRYHTLKEADARLVLLQVVNALRYLASLERPVIHYDLKPANVLFHSPDAHVLAIKITDFGLSKLLPRNDSNNGNNGNGKGDGAGSSGGGVCAGGPSDNPSIELTSQGTGTYWYLPPECFDTSSTTPPRISSKVDIWSVGVLFYQMLYGRRPFAEGESQRKIWQEQLIVRAARTLHFPDTPRVSEEAKALMRGCLAFHVAERYDIATLSQHPYLTRTTRRGTRSARNNSNNSSTMTATHTTTAAGLMPAPAAPAHAHASMATTATATAGVAPLLSTTSAEAAVPALSHTAPPPPPSSSSPADAAVE